MKGFLPEEFDYTQWQLGKGPQSLYPLRPELIESTYHQYRSTGDRSWLHAAHKLLVNLEKHTKVRCGHAAIQDVATLQLADEMPSFFLSETCKYLYLLFDEENFVHSRPYIMTTEAHLFDASQIRNIELTFYGLGHLNLVKDCNESMSLKKSNITECEIRSKTNSNDEINAMESNAVCKPDEQPESEDDDEEEEEEVAATPAKDVHKSLREKDSQWGFEDLDVNLFTALLSQSDTDNSGDEGSAVEEDLQFKGRPVMPLLPDKCYRRKWYEGTSTTYKPLEYIITSGVPDEVISSPVPSSNNKKELEQQEAQGLGICYAADEPAVETNFKWTESGTSTAKDAKVVDVSNIAKTKILLMYKEKAELCSFLMSFKIR